MRAARCPALADKAPAPAARYRPDTSHTRPREGSRADALQSQPVRASPPRVRSAVLAQPLPQPATMPTYAERPVAPPARRSPSPAGRKRLGAALAMQPVAGSAPVSLSREIAGLTPSPGAGEDWGRGKASVSSFTLQRDVPRPAGAVVVAERAAPFPLPILPRMRERAWRCACDGAGCRITPVSMSQGNRSSHALSCTQERALLATGAG